MDKKHIPRFFDGGETPKAFSDIEDDLKPNINNFLFSILPDSCTIKEMDELAVRIYESIAETCAKLKS